MSIETDYPTAAHILESITDAFFALDNEWRFTYINSRAEALWNRDRADMLGRNVWDEFPEAVGSTFDQQFRRAMMEGIAVSFEEFYPPLDAWLEVRAYPSQTGLSVYFHNINQRKAAELLRDQADAALRESEGRFRQMADAIPHIAWTTTPDGSVDYYNQRWYDYSGLSFEETRAWGWATVIHPADVEHASAVWRAALASGVVSEVEYRLRRADGEYRLHLGRSSPVLEGGHIARWVGTATDIEDRRQVEEALRESEERLRLSLEGVGMGTWHWDLVTGGVEWSPKTKALFGLPRDAPHDHARILTLIHPEDSRRVDASMRAAMAGGLDYNEEYRVRRPDGSLRWLASRGRVYRNEQGVAIRMEGVMEDVSARRELADRDRAIASQLQAALQPAPPSKMPGLALSSHYEVALKEAGVGGDFCDVFGLENNCTALVVGDLAGKGLEAAAQVATVRNMVRYAVFRSRTLAGAITNLNAVLVKQELLTGFSTLFVGAFDSAAQTLTYVNCGQEPGLVRRAATGQIEELPPTGPILGALENGVFEEETMALLPGDVLAVFTDGLTEVGPSRREMLGIDGVAALMKEAVPHAGAAQRAEAWTRRLISGVDAFARGGTRDDVCLLVGIVT